MITLSQSTTGNRQLEIGNRQSEMYNVLLFLAFRTHMRNIMYRAICIFAHFYDAQIGVRA